MSEPAGYPTDEPMTFGGVDPSAFPYERSAVAVLPIPYEATTSWGTGTREGPAAIVEASRHLELYDEELGIETYRHGIHTLPALASLVSSPREMVDAIYGAARPVLDDGKFLVGLGGEHTITPPLVRAHAERWPDLTILQIDAHGDLRDEFQGSRFSHACAMRRALEHARGVQVGIRSITAEEVAALAALPTRLFYAHAIRHDPAWIDAVVDALGESVYVTIDLDGLDPSIMPAVGTPEPGGLGWYETLELLRRVGAERRIVGADVNELAPLPGHRASSFLAAKLVYKLLGYALGPPPA